MSAATAIPAAAAAPAPGSATTQVPLAPADETSADDALVRAKRPPRVPRAREDGAPEGTVEDAVEAAGTTAVNGAPAAEGVTEGVVPVLSGGTPSAPPAAATVEADVVTLADGLPWPLPPATIVGERYRIAALLSAAPTPADENVYRVSDLRGYERCWSCGATAATATDSMAETVTDTTPERFCQQCGADMLAHEYLMRERLAQGIAQDDALGADQVEQVEAATPAPVEHVASQPQPHALPEERIVRQGMRVYRVSLDRDAASFPAGARVEVAAATDIGLDRSSGHNEDSVGFVVLQTAHDSMAAPLALCIVADGLGGHASGKEASGIVVRTVLDSALRQVALPVIAAAADAPETEEALKRVLREAVAAANDALVAANAERDLDMGSTVVAALISQRTAYIANAGDSRAYVLDTSPDGGALRRLTTDHSLVEQLIAGGMIAPEQRYTHPQRNQIFRSLGVGANQDVDLFTQQLRPGMRLLLCSDGLWEMVRDDELERVLRTTPDPQAACDELVRLANEHGGEDNISALVVAVGG
jgi:serine/threonine protein phosphatase PrpC